VRVLPSFTDDADAHVFQKAFSAWRRNLTGVEAVHDRVPVLVTIRLLIEDPFTRLRTEIVAPALILLLSHPRVPTQTAAACDRVVAHAAERRIADRMRVFQPAAVHIVDDDVPILAEGVVPAGILLFEPYALGLAKTTGRIPPDRVARSSVSINAVLESGEDTRKRWLAE
jgi:hypothetical protein